MVTEMQVMGQEPPGVLLRGWRKERGMTVRKAALGLGVSEKHLANLEAGGVGPSLEVAVRIENVTRGAVPAAMWSRREELVASWRARGAQEVAS